MKFKILDIFLLIMMILGYDYYSRRIVYYGGISIIDLIFFVYIIYTILIFRKKDKHFITKNGFLLFIFLFLDLGIGFIRGNAINLIYSNVMYIVMYFFVYCVFRNNNEYYNTNKLFKLFFVASIICSFIYIINKYIEHGFVYNYFNNRIGLSDDINENNRIFGPDLVFWIPTLLGCFFNKFKKRYIVIISFFLVGLPAIFIYKNRQIPIMIFCMILIILLYKSIKYKNKYKSILVFYILIFLLVGGFSFVKLSSNERINNIFNFKNDTSLMYRFYTNQDALAKIKNNFPIGSGLGSSFLFQLNSSSEVIEHDITDNLWITLLLKLNIITFLILLVYIVRLIINKNINIETRIIILTLMISTPISTVHITRIQYAFIIMYAIFKSKNKENYVEK
ncbi:TPA: O-antigen ligase family protein [Clostridium perfringens]